MGISIYTSSVTPLNLII